MKRDHDYVEFADYKRDMDELAASGAAAVEAMRQQVAELRTLINAAALSSGGRLTIYNHDLAAARDVATLQWRDEANNCVVLEAKRVG